MHARSWLGLTLVVFTSCQCFVPVDEPDAGAPDSGTDAGSDSGVDAGPGTDAGCVQPQQCPGGPRPTSSWCNTTQPDAGFSCIENQCVWECPLVTAGRTCRVNQGTYCLECSDASTSCPQTGTACGSPLNSTATVESGMECTNFTDVTIMRGASAQCRFFMSSATGAVGEVWKLESGEYVAFLPALGGWCTGRSAFTGAPRSIFNCPSCQFVLMGFE